MRVGIAEYRTAESPATLKASGLGSCLAIALYDSRRALGGMAHTLLPGGRRQDDVSNPVKFVDLAIEMMLNDLVAMGAERQDLVAKMAGGANMFASDFLSLVDGIGVRSAHSAREVLARLHIPLLAEDIGGNRGRTVEFDLATGRLLVYFARDKSTLYL